LIFYLDTPLPIRQISEKNGSARVFMLQNRFLTEKISTVVIDEYKAKGKRRKAKVKIK
jgi:hypothetical protein